MKVIHLNHSHQQGGAARAAIRIHQALCGSGVDSTMVVDSSNSGDPTVQGPSTRFAKLLARARPALSNAVMETFFLPGQNAYRSHSIFPSGRVGALNQCDADLLHLHWVQGEMLSIADIGRLKKRVVWTLHDMWAFCGAEHYTTATRWKEGYTRLNRERGALGLDLDRWTWERKRRHWQQKHLLVTPSQWLAQCVQQSALLGEWPVTVVPNAIDTDCWRPFEKAFARELFNLPQGVPLVLFGAIGGGSDPRKGFDLLKMALEHLRNEIPGLELVMFGQGHPNPSNGLGFPTHYTGHLHDDQSMRALYSAADVFVLPSRQDNLPNTGLESLACGVPIVAFDTGGLNDVVMHEKTGYLAKPFDTEDLARGIRWVLTDDNRLTSLKQQARQEAISRFSYEVVSPLYQKVYERACGGI
jgi:glycosyltransferase involved in cell wall biosynthesis